MLKLPRFRLAFSKATIIEPDFDDPAVQLIVYATPQTINRRACQLRSEGWATEVTPVGPLCLLMAMTQQTETVAEYRRWLIEAGSSTLQVR